MSTTRTYTDNNFNKQGIIEIVQDCGTVFKISKRIKKNRQELRIIRI